MISQKDRILIGVCFVNLCATFYVAIQPIGQHKEFLEGKLFEGYAASLAGLWGGFTMQDRITIEEQPSTKKPEN